MALDEHMKKAIAEVGEAKLRAAYKRVTLVYGTTGTGSLLGAAASELFSPILKKSRSTLSFYDPGPRTPVTMLDDHLMMDNYYGQQGTVMHLRRDPTIGEYVHRAMRFKGDFDMSVPGWKAYKQSYPNPMDHHGWQWPNKKDDSVCFFHRPLPDGTLESLKGTQYMSWAIQEGFAEFGGTLIFEGTMVYYNQVFWEGAGRRGDTDLEAINMFQYFAPNSSRAKFRDGTVIFHWGGKEAIPSHFKFQENWNWSGKHTHTSINWRTPEQRATEVLKPIWNNFVEIVPDDSLCVVSEQLLERDRAWKKHIEENKGATLQKAVNAFKGLAARRRARLAKAAQFEHPDTAYEYFTTQTSNDRARANCALKTERKKEFAKEVDVARRMLPEREQRQQLAKLDQATLAAESLEMATGLLPIDGVKRVVG